MDKIEPQTKEMDELLKVLTDPISNQIIQVLRVQGSMTISEILQAIPDLKRATVYRKIDKMLKVSAIQIVTTNKIRGQIEHIYGINDIYIAGIASKEESFKQVSMSLMKLLGTYETYFKSENPDVNRDKLFMFNYNIALNDLDFTNMVQEIYQVVDKYQGKSRKIGAIPRNLYLFSAPSDTKD